VLYGGLRRLRSAAEGSRLGLHVLHIVICLSRRSTEQVPAGVLEPGGILTVNNNNK